MIKFTIISLSLLTTLHAFDLPVPMQDKVPIEIESGFLGTWMKQDGKPLQPLSLHQVLAKYPECRADASAAKTLGYAATGFAAAGGVLIGFPIGNKISGGDFNAPIFYTGLGTFGIALVIGQISEHKLKKSVKAYNGALGKTSLQFNLTPSHQALAIQTQF